MAFEFDPNKSASNLEKHGIDFVEGQELWHDEGRCVIPVKCVEGEERFALIAKRGDSCYFAVYTIRGENIRIISIRKAREKEKEFYEEEK